MSAPFAVQSQACLQPYYATPMACVGCYPMAGDFGANIFDKMGEAFKQAEKQVTTFAKAVASRTVNITEKTFESVGELAKKGYKFFVGMTKQFGDKVVQGWNWLAGALKKALKATMNALKDFMKKLKQLFFEGIVKLARGRGRLSGMPESMDGFGATKADLTLKALGCAFEKHLAKPAVKAELVAEALAAIVGGIYSGGTAALAAAGAMVGRHGTAVMVGAAETGCKDVKDPIDPKNPMGGKGGLSPFMAASLGLGGVVLAMYLATDGAGKSGKKSGKLTHRKGI